MLRTPFSILLLATLAACTSPGDHAGNTPTSAAPQISFVITSDFAEDSAWLEPYLHDVAGALVRLMDSPNVMPPATIRVEVLRDANLPGIGGYATPEAIGFVSDMWPKEAHRLWIVAHEMANLFAHHYASGGGFPSDFWSNGRSPFPEYVSCIVMREAGYPEEAVWRKVVNKGKPDHDLYWRLDREHGFALFAHFFRLLRDDGVVIGDLGDEPWPAPDRTRSLFTIGYLSIAAGCNLAPMFHAAGVGREPNDWQERHPEIEFLEYTVTGADIEAFMKTREHVMGADADQHVREAFRQGRIANILGMPGP